ncbi:MAG: hypothetical protein MUP14_02065, partial [Dehalococcoidia bacterium]|nr:hypothetical protein [Dehalococcoidia bacterium]
VVFLIHESGLPIKEFVHDGNQHLWTDALEDPTPYVRWVVMVGEQLELTEDDVFRRLHDSPTISENYAKVFDSRGVTIYRRNDEVWPPSAVSGESP